MPTEKKFIIDDSGIYEECITTSRKRVSGFEELIQRKVEEASGDKFIVYPSIVIDNGLRVNMAVWKNRIVFARRFYKGPIGMHVHARNDGVMFIKPETASGEHLTKVPLVYDKDLWADVPEGQKHPEHWITFNPISREVTLLLHYAGEAWHPMLPNVHNSGKVCVGSSFDQDLNALNEDKVGATIFDSFRAAFNNVCRTPWNDDLRSNGFESLRWDASTGKAIPYSVKSLHRLSHSDHVAGLFS